MALSAGTRLGPYEIVAPLGAGGMGEVYRARDTRLAREVAIKVLPEALASDHERLKRFEKEAKSASALNHPNIVTIYDIGSDAGVSYIAMELVDGTPLRELLVSGPLPIRRLLQVAPQIAEGLARAHEAGIVHRDLKPENVMVKKDGLVKILDFGLAKLTSAMSGSGEGSNLPTMTGTTPGVVVGTVGYMSPEQASGATLDFRSDQFSFGSILYEMATGRRAFQKTTAIDTLAAILNEEPDAIAARAPQTPAPLRWIAERCLAKEPDGRYASTKDLAREVAGVRDHLSEAISGAVLAVKTRPRRVGLAAAAVILLAAGAILGRAPWKGAPASQPKFQRLTFRRGFVDEARFLRDGQTIVYSARWDGEPPHLFMTRRESPTSQRLDIPDASLLSVSAQGELAIVTGKAQIGGWHYEGGTLATVPLAGGAPREIATDIQLADWAPDGKRIAATRGGHLEFPLGKTIYKPREDAGGLALPRVSLAGDRIAFTEGARRVLVVDLAGRESFKTRKWGIIRSLAWSPSGDEVWFTAGDGIFNTLYAVNAAGRERVVFRAPGNVTIKDISRDGKVLLNTGFSRSEVWSRPSGQSRERDLTVLADSDCMGLAPDGKTLLINESQTSSNAGFYLRQADGSAPKRLGDGYGAELSPDGKWVAVFREGPPLRIVLVPTGAGVEKSLDSGHGEPDAILWSQDGRRLFIYAREKGHDYRLYAQDFAAGKPWPVTPEGPHSETLSVSPDGRFVVAERGDAFWKYPVDGGEKSLVPGLRPGVDLVWRNWSEDGRSLYVWSPRELPFRVFRFDLATGKREPWMTIAPQDPDGIWGAELMLTPDGKSYAYNCSRSIQDLYLVEGLK